MTDDALASARTFFAALDGGAGQLMQANSMFQLATFEAGKFTQKTFIPNGKEALPDYLAAHPMCVRSWQLTKQFKYGHSEFSFDWAMLGTLAYCDGRARYFEITTDAKRRYFRSFSVSDQATLMLGRYRK
ncbi:MAG: hypothetical protein KBE07_08715 [Rhodoferax sp.]|nr:hypothetical protein [Rhodoferax sp.]MBP9684723.1 hypothetical protein [Rhodoferax sp.]